MFVHTWLLAWENGLLSVVETAYNGLLKSQRQTPLRGFAIDLHQLKHTFFATVEGVRGQHVLNGEDYGSTY